MSKIKDKVTELKDKSKEKLKAIGSSVVNVMNERPDMIIPIITGVTGIVAGVITGIGNLCGVSTNCSESCLVEDDVTGMKFHTKHPLANSEILELSERMIDGQTKGDALNERGF